MTNAAERPILTSRGRDGAEKRLKPEKFQGAQVNNTAPTLGAPGRVSTWPAHGRGRFSADRHGRHAVGLSTVNPAENGRRNAGELRPSSWGLGVNCEV